MVDEEDIITLIDEDNNEVQFEHVLTLEIDGKEYILLSPLEPMEGLEEDEAIVLRVEKDENGEDIYVSLDDENEIQTVYETYMEVIAEYDEEDEEDEDFYSEDDEQDQDDDDDEDND